MCTRLRSASRWVLLTSTVVAILLGTACRPDLPPSPAPATPLPPTAIPATATALPPPIELPYTPVPLSVLSPVVIQRTPEAGERLQPDGSIELVFDRAMDQTSVEAAFRVQPQVAGAITWTDARSFSFKPSAPLPRNATLDVALTQQAKAADGAMLRQPFQFRVTTQGNLEVGQTIPADGTQDAHPDTIVTVLFNRPVVPLTTLNEQAGLPQPLSFDPPIDGKTEWLNTSILVFRPTRPLPGGMTFRGRISADLADTDGNPLPGEYTWTFSTSAPKVLSVTPDPQGRTARIDTPVVVMFNQDVDAASAQAAFTLADTNGQPVAGQFAVLSNTLTFTPAARLAFDTVYAVRVAAGVRSASGGNGSVEAWSSTFRTVPLPRVVGTEPANGTRDAYPGTPFIIRFNTEIDPHTVLEHVRMTPALSPTQVYTYYNEYDYSFVLYFGAEPATDYAVEITPGIADPYGNRTQETVNVSFRTRDMEPSAYIAVPYGIATLNAYQPARLVATVINVGSLDLELTAFDTTDARFMLRDERELSAAKQSPVRQWNQPISAPPNKIRHVTLDLAADGGKLPPGAYWLKVTSPDIPRERFNQRIVLIVSEINLTLKSEPEGALVWATDLQTGQPVSGLPVTFYTVRYAERPEVVEVGSGSTDSNGVAQTAISRQDDRGGYGETIAVAGERFAATASGWSSGISFYDFNIPWPRDYGYYGSNASNLKAYLYTDRPIYRPGQTVYLRGIVRNEDDVQYAVPPAGMPVRLRVDDAQGQNLLSRMVATDEYGAFNAEVVLAEGAPLGTYNMSVEIETAGERSGYSYAQFTVSAYRPPEYEVTVTPGSAEAVRGTTLTATVEAKYLSGGALRNTPVNWNVIATQAVFDPPQLDQYTFSDNDNPWYCFDCWRYPGYEPPRQPLFRGEGTTDERGRLELSLPISLELRDSMGQLITGPLSLSIEANASGADNQVIAGRSSVLVHPASYYIGIAFTKYLIEASRPATVELVTVDWQGARLPGKALDVSVYRREWKNTYNETSGQWSYEISDELVTDLSASTDAQAEARVIFTPTQAGTYRVVARAQDEAGRLVQSSRFIWATGNEFIPWLRENNDRINLIANKTSFDPGETAEILIPSPFQGEHYALVTVERGHILQHEVIPVTSSSQVYRLALPPQFAPNVFVSVVLFKGMAAPTPVITGEGSSRPDFKVGYLNLEVRPIKQVFNITLTPDQKLAQPGQSVNYTLQATDSEGQPVAGQFSLDLVDKGILNLLPRQDDAIVQAFYGQRGTRVQTSSGLSISANRITEDLTRRQREEESLAYNGARGDTASGAAPAPQATSAPAAAEAPAADMAKQESGQSQAQQAQIRENFADTAYWSPAVTTDAEGKATVSIKLPDNLTTWVLRAVGVDNSTRVGEGTTDVVATKPLLIRPVTPRFVVVDDVVELGAVVNNNTDQPQTAVVALSEATNISLTTPISQEVTIPAQGEVSVRWMGSVGSDASVSLVFSVANEQYNDASRPRLSTAPNGGLKVNRWSAPEVVGTAGDLEQADSRTEIVALPPRLDTTQGALTVRLDPSLAASMQAGLTYLEDYPYEHAEAVLSRFLPNVLNYQALMEFNIRDAALETKLRTLVSSSLEKLYSLQNGDGGWGWWHNMESSPYISTYIVFGLLRARAAGFEVANDRIERGLAYLRGTLRDTGNLRQYYEFNRQTFVLYVLGEAGQGDTTRVNELFEARDKLSLYAKALLALTIGKTNAQDERLKTLFADLNGKVIQSATGAHWEEQYVDWWAMNTDTRSTAIILSAMAQFDPSNNLVPNVVRWLMVSRKDGIWNNTQETAWSLIALTDWVRATGELRADYAFGAMLNEQAIVQGQATAQTLTQTQVVNIPIADLLRDAGNRLTILRGDGPGRLYYTAHLKAYLPVPSIKAADRGMQVYRRYTLASCTEGIQCPEITSAKVGDVIRVNLTLIAPNELYYVQLEDPIPAGTEVVDTGLTTTSQLAEGPTLQRAEESRYWWWWFWYSRSELRDDRVALFADYLSKGTYEYSYTIRATSAGQFNVIPAFVNEQYFPEVFGRSDGSLFTVTR